MANINGNNQNNHIVGTANADTIDGRRGDDWIEGGDGDDTLTGEAGRDTFVLRDGDGNDAVTDFTPGTDKVLFDFNGYSDILFIGPVEDGMTFTDFTGDTFHFASADVNGDGEIDTVVTVNGGDTITLLGVAPSDLHGSDFMGG